MRDGILISVVGKTDPIRGEHDGPILHIIRHYQPEMAILLLSVEIEKIEDEYHYNEEAIHMLDKGCEVKMISTGVEDAHSYDAFSVKLLKICNDVRKQYPEKKIFLNISSGTPQMETALCMIAISDPAHYIAVQVASPERASNSSSMFNPEKDLIEEWFEMNLDNEEGSLCRCQVPELLNFKRPIVQFQIQSLMENYDYSGALLLYADNRQNFSEKTGVLLEHAKRRLNLEYKEAEHAAEKLGLKRELYPVARPDIRRLVEFYNSMRIKQVRGELNDFSMRLEIMILGLGEYMMEECMRVPLKDIVRENKLKNSYIMYLSKEKCTEKIPGIEAYLDEQFSDKKLGRFEWGKPVNALSIVYIVRYLSRQPGNERFINAAEEMVKWVNLSVQVRNPAAHTIVAITDDIIKESYDGKGSGALVKSMKTILMQAFGGEAKEDAFGIYEKINRMVKEAMED